MLERIYNLSLYIHTCVMKMAMQFILFTCTSNALQDLAISNIIYSHASCCRYIQCIKCTCMHHDHQCIQLILYTYIAACMSFKCIQQWTLMVNCSYMHKMYTGDCMSGVWWVGAQVMIINTALSTRMAWGKEGSKVHHFFFSCCSNASNALWLAGSSSSST